MPEPISMGLLATSVVAGLIRYARRKFHQAKCVFDIAVAGILLALLSPVIGVVALLIRLCNGPGVIFRQVRVGKGGRLFLMYKFRTMKPDAEAETGPIWAAENDPRCTRLGRILRRTYLDELPQLLNVIKGEMSLVGPRPERPHFVEQLSCQLPEYSKRLEVKPGITGLAQVEYGAEHNLSDTRTKLDLDLTYIRKMCWSTDFRILLATLGKVGNKKQMAQVGAQATGNNGKITG